MQGYRRKLRFENINRFEKKLVPSFILQTQLTSELSETSAVHEDSRDVCIVGEERGMEMASEKDTRFQTLLLHLCSALRHNPWCRRSRCDDSHEFPQRTTRVRAPS